jgi:hypothetical protein
MMHTAGRLAYNVLNNPYGISILSWFLVFVPIIGMWAVHKYGWEHWEPFTKKHK